MHRNVFGKKKNQATMNLRCNSHLYTKLTNTEPKLSPCNRASQSSQKWLKTMLLAHRSC